MSVAEASLTAYRAHTALGHAGQQQRAILAVMLPGERYSRRELATRAGIETSACAGRCNELLDAGLIVTAGDMLCSITGRTVVAVSLPPAAGVQSGTAGRNTSSVMAVSSTPGAGPVTAPPGTNTTLREPPDPQWIAATAADRPMTALDEELRAAGESSTGIAKPPTRIDTYSEAWRHECEMRDLVRMYQQHGADHVKNYLDELGRKRGKESAKAIRQELWERIKIGRAWGAL